MYTGRTCDRHSAVLESQRSELIWRYVSLAGKLCTPRVPIVVLRTLLVRLTFEPSNLATNNRLSFHR